MRLLKLLVLPLLLFSASCDLDKVEETPVITPFALSFPVGSNQSVVVETVLETPAGDGFLVSGTLFGNSTSTMFILKVNNSGTLVDIATNFGSGTVSGGKMIRTSDDRFIVVGTQELFNQGQILVTSFDENLSKQWSQVYPFQTEPNVFGSVAAEAPDGNIIVAGYYDHDVTPGHLLMHKLNPDNGLQIDFENIELPDFGFFRPVSIVPSGNSFGILCFNLAISLPSPYFVKINNQLQPLITQSLNNGIGNADGEMVADASDGFVAAHGVLASLSRTSFLVPVNGNGVESNEISVWGNFIDSGMAGMSKTSGGKYIPCGWASIADVTNGGIPQATASLVGPGFQTEDTYMYPENALTSKFSASSPVSDGGFILAGTYGDDLLLVKLNSQFDTQ